jgi:hypothetical protein
VACHYSDAYRLVLGLLLVTCRLRMVCSINTAWLSVASSVAAMVVPAAHGARQGTELVAVSLAALFTVVGEPGQLTALSCMTCSLRLPPDGASDGPQQWDLLEGIC